MRLIQTTHLKTWASSKSAENRFPHIVKALICAVIRPDQLRMPSGDAVWVPGFDGVLLSHEANRFVPTGLSVWELGTTVDFRGKAKEDYDKRSKDNHMGNTQSKAVRNLDRSQTAFVFVTPLVWVNKDQWVAERLAEGIWKDVVIFDGVDLQDWIESAPAVNLHFAAELGIVPEKGLQTCDQAWEEWSYWTRPPASQEIVTAGREEQEKELLGRLIAPPSTFTVRGDSHREAWGFALAALIRVGSEEERLSLEARTIVAENEEVAGNLRNLSNLIIVLKQTHSQVSGFLSSRGCHVVVPEGNDGHSQHNVIALTRPSQHDFSKALEKMGMSPEEAQHAARACGRSVTILQRQHAHANVQLPKWADDISVVELLPAILAGRWNDRNEADQKILCHLADVPDYGDVSGHFQQFLFVDQPPLQKVGDMWTLTAPVDAFQLMARRLTSRHLIRFKEAFRDVFGRVDAKVEIPPDDWIYSDLMAQNGHSGWLRSGMAETLLLIAERGPNARLVCVQSPSSYAADVVNGIPGLSEDWRVLASLRDQYARLMEAAPSPLLDSLERLLEAKPDDIRQLFNEGHGIFGGTAMHTGLLWGLETLAWSPEFLPRVALTLARLSSLDPGGRLHNRPINSLREIFLWWHLGTNAALDQRLTAIDLILVREPDVGWTLLSTLLPSAGSSISQQPVKPRWRDFGDPPEVERTREGQLRYLSSIVDRVLDRVGTSPDRWRSVLDALRVLSDAQQRKALGLLEAVPESLASTDPKATFWEMLRDFIYEHRSFEDADWALSGELIDRLDAVLARLAPGDPIQRSRWLFDEWIPDLPSAEKGWEHREQRAIDLRLQAAEEIFEGQGINGLITLGTTCKYPAFVAIAIMPLLSDPDAVRGFIQQTILFSASGMGLASQISNQARQLYGEAWCDLVRKEAKAGTWTADVTASLVVLWPDGRPTWEVVTAMGEEVATEYWHRKPIYNINGPSEDQTYQIDQYIANGRAVEAFDRIALDGEGVPTETLVRLFDATLDQLSRKTTADEIRRLGLSSHRVRGYLDELRKRPDLAREELARREYQALPLLGWTHGSGLTIPQLMAEDPTFFVDVLCDCFLPSHRDKSENAEQSSEIQARAQVAYRLLEGLDLVPGHRDAKEIDEEALLGWVKSVREKAAVVDRAAIADQKIGAILANSPIDPRDACWPHRVVRNVLEKVASEEIDHGLLIKRFNMRGVYSKDMYEGGAQEIALANEYRRWSDISRGGWPRTTRILERVAAGWEEDARRADLRAEQEKME